jgi:DNA-directed RNA polymerase subunit RPC12/RpoP
MSGKVKVRCARCGKQFRSANAKQTFCTNCEIKERQARAAGKTQEPKPVAAPTKQPHQPKIVGPGAGILVPGMAPAAAPAEPEHSVTSASPAQAKHTTHQHPPAGATATLATPTHDKHDKHDKQERQGAAHAQPKPASQPKPAPEPKQRKPPTPPFVLTDEHRAQIEDRYLELAQPVEFDGIRTQIAEELHIPKSAVRRVVQDVRTRLQMPSWWELQSFSGSDEDLSHIRAAYEPLLPVPPVGIHKHIATSLGLEPIMVYHGIRRIRAEMRLPQYNPPELHAASNSSQEAAASQSTTAASSDQSSPRATAG